MKSTTSCLCDIVSACETLLARVAQPSKGDFIHTVKEIIHNDIFETTFRQQESFVFRPAFPVLCSYYNLIVVSSLP